jgi:hypothetical protein
MDAEVIALFVGWRGQRQVIARKRDGAHLRVADPVRIDACCPGCISLLRYP